MTPQIVIDLFMASVYAATELALPILLTALVIGLVISIFQAATQINEATLSFLPKIIAMLAVIILVAPWMIRRMTTFTQDIYAKIPEIVRVHK
jgi:flagellar biosynthetic protein FliQ